MAGGYSFYPNNSTSFFQERKFFVLQINCIYMYIWYVNTAWSLIFDNFCKKITAVNFCHFKKMLHIEYPICTDNSYSFQDKNYFVLLSSVHIPVCKSVYLYLFFCEFMRKMPAIELSTFFHNIAKVHHSSCSFQELFAVQLYRYMHHRDKHHILKTWFAVTLSAFPLIIIYFKHFYLWKETNSAAVNRSKSITF